MLRLVLFLTGAATVLNPRTSADKEQLLDWTNNSSNECLITNLAQKSGQVDNQEKRTISPDHSDLQTLGKNVNSNNNNYNGSPAPLHPDEEMDIAFVLDGSSSIRPEDFERAKDFITNTMQNFWTRSFSCRIAVVQYADDIRTELSLNENNDHQNAREKVKNMNQLFGNTMTASALYHVLTEVFVPQSGSRENAIKMIILLSDGEMSADNRTLTEVLNMTQMEGIVRYAIGIGPEVQSPTQAVNEMMEIAGDKDRLLQISNDGSLESISSLIWLYQQAIQEMPSEKQVILYNYSHMKKSLSTLVKGVMENEGMEIAFVLEGSNEIKKRDFKRAKEFIINLMERFWKICFSCRFAVVQYGTEIQTKLSLNENDNHYKALDKVKSINQLPKSPRTASALYHVLTEVFVPQSGSKEKATKIIILLSDGRMSGDNRTLTEVLNMPQMEGVDRYVIGVLGLPGILGNKQERQEMIKTAGSEDRFIEISNYAALENIFYSLERIIREVEEKETGKEILQFCLSYDPQRRHP